MMDTMSHSTSPVRTATPRLLDWTVAILGIWLIGAVHLDAWAHHRVALETFFTPWHGVLCAGFLAALLVGTAIRGRRRGEEHPAGRDRGVAPQLRPDPARSGAGPFGRSPSVAARFD